MRLIALASVIVAGCATPASSNERVWSVAQLHSKMVQLDGQTVTVRGWLPRCRGRDCTLYPSKEAEAAFERNLGHNRILSIGAEPQFDQAIRNQVPATVVLRARVNAMCFRKPTRNPNGSQDIIVCGDRSDDLIPLQIISLERAAPSTDHATRK